MANHKRILCCLAALICTAFIVNAQNAQTFVHNIKQGETVFSIARTYNVSTQEIFSLNPEALDGIKAGAQLIIPQKQATSSSSQRFHTIAAGETLYSLTRHYQISIDQICQANPGLTAENFKAGMVILIPEAPKQAPVQAVAPQQPAQPKCREMHKVQRRETVEKIAEMYQISVDELKEANPEMKKTGYKLERGSFVCIPYKKVQKTVTVETPANKELICEPEQASPQKTVRLGVILPFQQRHKESGRMIEFYRGILMAADSLRKSGTSMDIYAFDSGKTPQELQKLLNSRKLPQLDFIVGPLYAEQIPALSQYCQKNNTRLVVPFSSLGDEVFNMPTYFSVSPPKSFQVAVAAELTWELFKKQNFIFLDSKETDTDAASFTEAIEKQLQQNGITSKKVSINSDEFAWLKALTKYSDNIIIPNSSSIKVLNTLFPVLKELTGKYPEYRIKMVGYPEWQTYTSKHLENFYRFDTYAYSQFYRNPMNDKSNNFDRAYRNNFHQQPINSCPRFGLLGFDLGYYFLKGIATYGKGFENNLQTINNEALQHRFCFSRVSNWSGFINKEMQFIHYTPSQSIELIRLKQ